MAGRKLTQRQSRRVARQQSRHADQALTDSASTREGLVISRFGKQVDIEAAGQPGELVRCYIRSNIDSLVAGDRVAWVPSEEGGGVVVARQPRHSLLERPDSFGRLRAVAANLDQIIIVLATEPPPFTHLLDRYLVAAEHTGLQAIILVNKMDLDGRDLLRSLMPYQQIGYPVIGVSAMQTDGLSPLQTVLKDRTSAFVGQSGVGKSSLIAAFLPNETIRIGALSSAESKGRHTTTAARLFHLVGGGDLIDSPGIRDFSLGHLDAYQSAAGFIEFRPWLSQCRFRDCTHQDEPGCAVVEAVEQNVISADRYLSYRQIITPTDHV